MNKQELRAQLESAIEAEDYEMMQMLDAALQSDYDSSPKKHRYDVLGSPAPIRAAVGNAKTPADKLATLRQWYPDAKKVGERNYAYTDEGGKRTLYNKEGRSFNLKDIARDLSEYSRVPFEAAGQLAGAIVGIPGGMPGVMIGAGLGGETAGQLYDQTAKRTLGTVDTRGAPDQFKDAALSAGFNSMGGLPKARTVAATGLDDLLAGSRGAAADVGRLSPVQRAQPEMRTPVARTAAALGQTPTVSQNTPPGALHDLAQTVEGRLSTSLTGSGPIKNRWDGLAQSADDIIKQNMGSGKTSPVGAGQDLQAGVQQHFADRKSGISGLYAELDRLISANGRRPMDRVQAENIRRVAKEHMAKLREAGDSAGMRYKTELDNIAETLAGAKAGDVVGVDGLISDNKKLPWQMLKEQRTQLFERQAQPLTANTSQGDIKRLIGNLTDDLRAGADELGGPEAVAKFDQASAATRAMKDSEKVVNKAVGSQLGPEMAFKSLESAWQRNPTKFTEIMQTLQPRDREAAIGALLYRATRATPGNQGAEGGELSLRAAKTALNRVLKDAPENMQWLTPDQRVAMKRVMTIADDLGDLDAYKNFSGTGGANELASFIEGLSKYAVGGAVGGGAVGMDPVVTAGAAAGAPALTYLLAKVMANPGAAKRVATIQGRVSPGEVIKRLMGAEGYEATAGTLDDVLLGE